MLCLINYCRIKSNVTTGIHKSLRPQMFRPILTSILKYTGSPCQPSKPANQVSFRPYQPQCFTDHDYKNMALKRPMSPHLTIVTMTEPAFMSIMQRITGIMASVSALLLAVGALFLSNGVETYVSMIQSLNLGGFLIMLLKFLVGLPFSFHYFNGIRFCLWNICQLMELKAIASSAKACMIATVAAAALFALM